MMMIHATLALLLATFFCTCHGAKSGNRGLQAKVVGKKGKRGKRMKKTPAPTISLFPTYEPTTTAFPTYQPTTSAIPTQSPTFFPTETSRPSPLPSQFPTSNPTKQPTTKPSKTPTLQPTPKPTKLPTLKPTGNPTKQPSREPTFSPTTTWFPTITTLPTNSPTATAKKGKKKSKQPRVFESRAIPKTPTPAVTDTAEPSRIPNQASYTMQPTVHAKKGKKGKRPKGKDPKAPKQEERTLRKGKGVVGRRKKHAKGTQAPVGNLARAEIPSSAPIAAVTKATGKGSVFKHRRKKHPNTTHVKQGKQARIENPSGSPVGVVTTATKLPKGSGKSGGPKGANKGDSSPAAGTMSTITFRSPDGEGPAEVIEYEPPGKKGDPVSKTAKAVVNTKSISPVAPAPTTSPSHASVSAKSKAPTAGASQAGLKSQVFATVELPKFSLNFSVGNTSASPTEQSYKELSVITAELLDGIFFDFFEGSNSTHYYSTDIASYNPTSTFEVEFGASCHFLMPTTTPTPFQLASVLNDKYSGKSFLALLKRLAATNVFSKTSHVTLEIDPSVLEPITPTSGGSTATPKSSGTKVNTKVIAPVAAGALVAILAAAVLCYRKRRRSVADEGTLTKKPPSEETEDGTVEGSCYNSVVSRANRSNGQNGVATSTAEFGETSGDYDDCATQASGSYSMKPLPTIGESDDEVASDPFQQHEGDRSRNVSSPCTTDEMSLSEVPLFEDSDGEI